jgi:hypothetical protein
MSLHHIGRVVVDGGPVLRTYGVVVDAWTGSGREEDTVLKVLWEPVVAGVTTQVRLVDAAVIVR